MRADTWPEDLEPDARPRARDAVERDPHTDPASDRLGRVSGLMGAVSTAYTAAHGHPLEHDGLVARERDRRRWSLGMRTALVAAVVLVALAGMMVLRDLVGSSGDPVPIEVADPQATIPAGGESEATADAGAETGGAEVAGGEVVGGEQTGDGADTGRPLVVHVVGQVAAPGVVELRTGDRVIDAVTAAGGFTAEADPGSVNLARELVDGEQVYVAAPGEQPPPVTTPGVDPGSPEATGPIDLNTADAAELDSLPGIGPALAARILAWRTDNGAFMSVDELTEVAGIGPAVLEKIRDLVTV